MIKKIQHDGKILAIIIKSDFTKEGIEFFTPNEFSQQLAFMKHPKGKVIGAHKHNIVKREVLLTQEVLLIKKGKVKVNFYDANNNYLESQILSNGDVILLASGASIYTFVDIFFFIAIK